MYSTQGYLHELKEAFDTSTKNPSAALSTGDGVLIPFKDNPPVFETDDLTWSFWYKPVNKGALKPAHAIFYAHTHYKKDGYYINFSDNGKLFFSQPKGKVLLQTKTVKTALIEGWHMYTLIKKGKEVKIYRDGVSLKVEFKDNGKVQETPEHITISYPTKIPQLLIGTGQKLTGSVAELFLMDKVLPEDLLVKIYNKGKPHFLFPLSVAFLSAVQPTKLFYFDCNNVRAPYEAVQDTPFSPPENFATTKGAFTFTSGPERTIADSGEFRVQDRMLEQVSYLAKDSKTFPSYIFYTDVSKFAVASTNIAVDTENVATSNIENNPGTVTVEAFSLAKPEGGYGSFFWILILLGLLYFFVYRKTSS
jgi:hypothetical protein